MLRPFMALFLFFLTLVMISCNKSAATTPTTTTLTIDTASITGQWTWTSQSGTAVDPVPLTATTTHILKTLTFDTAGNLYITHNDSVLNDNFLLVSTPLVLLAAPETDTATYEVTSAVVGCGYLQVQALDVNGAPLQLYLSANTDTLIVNGDPCLSRARDVYIRN